VHVDAPIEASSFSQESGQAGRDGQKAFSIVLLWSS
jgi:superfamily II DNA helicase RecQ